MSETASFKTARSFIDSDQMPSILITPPSPTPSVSSACRRYTNRTSLTPDQLARSTWILPETPRATIIRRRRSPLASQSPRALGLCPPTLSEVHFAQPASSEPVALFSDSLLLDFDETHLTLEYFTASKPSKRRSIILGRLAELARKAAHVVLERLRKFVLCDRADADFDAWDAVLDDLARSFIPPASRFVDD